jgi:hypothetical protein
MKSYLRTTTANSNLAALLALIFIATRAWLWKSGLRYSTTQAASLWQLIDLELLRDHLVRSLYLLHSQPPALNLFVGLAEKLAGSHFGSLIVAVQMLLALAAILAIYLTLIHLEIAPLLAFSVGLLMLFNPTEMTYEFDALYSEICYTLLCFLTLAIVWFLRSRATIALYALVGLMVSLTLVRSTYQWVWILAVLAVLWLKLKNARPRILTAALIGICLSLLWPAKNYLVFHHFTSSTWAPFSMAKHWSSTDPAMERWSQQRKVLTFPAAVISDQDRAAWLRDQWQTDPAGDPQLDDIVKHTGGELNWNSLAMLRMHDAQTADVSFLLRTYRGPYLRGVAAAVFDYFKPSSDYYLVYKTNDTASKYAAVERLDRVERRICCNLFGLPPEAGSIQSAKPVERHATTKTRLQSICVGAVLCYLLLVAALVSLRRQGVWNDRPHSKLIMIVSAVTIGYAFLLSNLLEVGENMRFRLETQPLVFVVLAIFLQQLWDRRLRRMSVPA